MTPPVLALVGAGQDRPPVVLQGEDRVQTLAAPIRGISRAMVAVAAGSLVIHAGLMALAVVAARTPLVLPQPHEISVEVVREAPKQEAPKQEAQKPPAPAAPPPKAQQDPDAASQKAMREELESLRAKHAALEAQLQESARQTPASPAPSSPAQDPSGKALALPSIGGDGDAIGYQQLVFSQLAKAKGDKEYRGEAGTTAVRFEIDAAGKLVRVDIVRSSGSAVLDGRALDIIHRAAPFPPPPTVADRTILANVNFVPAEDP